jgi:hypothetical protein
VDFFEFFGFWVLERVAFWCGFLIVRGRWRMWVGGDSLAIGELDRDLGGGWSFFQIDFGLRVNVG